MLIIRGPIKPYIFWIKIILAIFLANPRPDKTIFSALTNLTIEYKCWIRSDYFVLFVLPFASLRRGDDEKCWKIMTDRKVEEWNEMFTKPWGDKKRKVSSGFDDPLAAAQIIHQAHSNGMV